MVTVCSHIHLTFSVPHAGVQRVALPPSSEGHRYSIVLVKYESTWRLWSWFAFRDAFCLQNIVSKFLLRVRAVYLRRGFFFLFWLFLGQPSLLSQRNSS